MEPHYTGERNSRYMCGIIYLMKITPKTNTPFQSKWATGNFTLATKGTWHQERDTCLGVSRGRYDCGETHNTPLHQESAWLFERFGRAESANDKPQTRAGTLVSNSKQIDQRGRCAHRWRTPARRFAFVLRVARIPAADMCSRRK